MSASDVAAALAAGGPVRIAAGGTKAGWGHPVELPPLEVRGLDRILDYTPGDFTAVLQAGVRLADAQAAFAAEGQRLALDPPGDGATIGGVVATADSGPLRHRYGGPRDLVIGVQMALSDGTLARAGGRVIKNVAGYDLGKLAAGSFGTLGVITEVCVRLHPLPPATATVVVPGDTPEGLAAVALDLAARPLELDALDVRWDGGDGAVLARFAGLAAAERAAAVGEPVLDDAALWEEQRRRQRSEDRIIARVAGLPTDLARIMGLGMPLVARAGIGTAWVELADADDVARVRREIGRPCVVTDAPASVRAELDVWDLGAGGELALMRRVRDRFDPARVCNGALMPT